MERVCHWPDEKITALQFNKYISLNHMKYRRTARG